MEQANSFMNTHNILNVINGNLNIRNNYTKENKDNFTTTLIFTNEISPAGSFYNTINVKNALYHFTYDYGLGEGYITIKKPDIVLNNPSAVYLLGISGSIDVGLLVLLYILRKYKTSHI